MGKSERTKGHAFERKVAADLRRIFPEARRHLEYQDGEAYGVDIERTGRFRIQCKKLRKYAPIERIFEVKKRDEREIPILVTAGDLREPMAVLPWRDFLDLLSAWSREWAADFY